MFSQNKHLITAAPARVWDPKQAIGTMVVFMALGNWNALGASNVSSLFREPGPRHLATNLPCTVHFDSAQPDTSILKISFYLTRATRCQDSRMPSTAYKVSHVGTSHAWAIVCVFCNLSFNNTPASRSDWEFVAVRRGSISLFSLSRFLNGYQLQ